MMTPRDQSLVDQHAATIRDLYDEGHIDLADIRTQCAILMTCNALFSAYDLGARDLLATIHAITDLISAQQ